VEDLNTNASVFSSIVETVGIVTIYFDNVYFIVTKCGTFYYIKIYNKAFQNALYSIVA